MFRSILPSLLCGLIFPLTSFAAEDDDDARRQRLTPGLIVDSGARRGDCDGLRFLPDGSELLVYGDDKLVRRFAVENDTLIANRLPALRWPIYRETRGMIFALDLPPDAGDPRVVFAGLGVNDSRVVIVNRLTGKIEQTLDPLAYVGRPYSRFPIWRAKFSPDGKRVVLGDDRGQLFVWTPEGAAPTNVEMFRASEGKARNTSLLIEFVGATEFISISEEGSILKWNLNTPNEKPLLMGKPFPQGLLARAQLSPDRKTLALLRMGVKNIKIKDSLLLFELGTGKSSEIPIPNASRSERVFFSVAFSTDSNRVALGSRELMPLDLSRFDLEMEGKVFVLEKKGEQPFSLIQTLPCSNNPQQLAFHPKNHDLLAVAGGDHHELTLWNVTKPESPNSVIRSSGRSIWSVGLSPDGKQLGFQTERNPRATHPNRLGSGDWRVYDIAAGKFAPSVEKFERVETIEELKNPDWQVKPTLESEIWELIGPGGAVYPLKGALYNVNENGRPRCYSFIPVNPNRKEIPPRLVVGHNWGATVYELTTLGPKLVRYFAGHEGPTVSLGVSRDGDVLVSGSWDQTICGWSLVDWPQQRELGASFAVKDRKLIANQIAKGSPSWEVGLSSGDEILGLFDQRGSYFVGPGYTSDQLVKRLKLNSLLNFTLRDADGTNALLTKAEPLKTLYFVWRRKDGSEGAQLTTIRQRPMWRFFPTDKNEFIAWLWRDYYYHTNATEPDRLAGWQVHDDFRGDPLRKGDDTTPVFYPLTALADARLDPEKVREAMQQSISDPDLESFSQIEPPQVTLRLGKAKFDGSLPAELFAMANREQLQKQDIQNLIRFELFVNDTLVHEGAIDGGGKFELSGLKAFSIDPKFFIKGRNRIRLNVYNKGDCQGSDVQQHFYTPSVEGAKVLHFLGVGVSDYRNTKPPQGTLSGAGDARRMLNEVCQPELKGNLYASVNSVLLLDRDVKAASVLSKIEEMSKQVKSAEDIFVLFLAGHGAPFRERNAKTAGKWFFLCSDTDIKNAETCLFGYQLAAALEKIPCRKVVFLDACHSSSVTEDQLKTEPTAASQSLTRKCDKVIFAACGPNESAWERANKGLFTDAIVLSLSEGNTTRKTVSAIDLKNYLEKRVPADFEKLKELQRKQDPNSSIFKQSSQTPFTFRADLEAIELFSRAK